MIEGVEKGEEINIEMVYKVLCGAVVVFVWVSRFRYKILYNHISNHVQIYHYIDRPGLTYSLTYGMKLQAKLKK